MRILLFCGANSVTHNVTRIAAPNSVTKGNKCGVIVAHLAFCDTDFGTELCVDGGKRDPMMRHIKNNFRSSD